jgi:hypothetical protein
MIRARHPEAEELAYDRIFARTTNLFNTRTHKALHPEPLTLAVLYFANVYAHQTGSRLVLTSEEEKVWRRRFQNER